MKRKAWLAISLAVLLVLTTVGIALAASETCPRVVNGKTCGLALRWNVNGQSQTYGASHEYGGILGMFTKTCNYKYYNIYQHYECSKLHVKDMRTTRQEFDHQCGKK